MEMHYCEICGQPYAELHHIVFRSENKALEDSEFNFKYLCHYHHRDHKEGIHHNRKFNLQEKRKLQERLFNMISKESTEEEIGQALQLKDKNLKKILRTILPTAGKYNREDVVRACMGGKLY